MTTQVERYEQGNTSLKTIVGAFFRHRRLFAATVALVFGLVVVATLLTHKEYSSEMNMLVQNNRASDVISTERSNGYITPIEVTEERLNSEIEVLSSKDIADAVVDPDWLSVPLKDRTDAEVHAHDAAVANFHKRLTIELLHKSDIIHVTYLDTTPRKANEMLNRVLTAFLAKQRQLEHPTGSSNFFTSEAERSKNELDAAQKELAAYQQQMQMVSLPDKEATLEEQITDLQDQIRATEVQMGEARKRIDASTVQLETIPPRQNTQQRSIPNNASAEQLTVVLTDLRNKRTELLTKYPPTERLVKEIDQKIATTTEAIRVAASTSSQENATDVNPVWQQMKSSVAQTITDLEALQQRRVYLQAQLVPLQAKLTGVENASVEFNTLQQKVTELQGNYQLYSQKRDEAQLSDAMDKQQLLNVAVVEPPTLSSVASKPQTLLNLITGAFTALFLGACVIFLAEMGRETISTPQELEAVSQHAVLATVPYMPDAHWLKFSPLRLGDDPGPPTSGSGSPAGSGPASGGHRLPPRSESGVMPERHPRTGESSERRRFSIAMPSSSRALHQVQRFYSGTRTALARAPQAAYAPSARPATSMRTAPAASQAHAIAEALPYLLPATETAPAIESALMPSEMPASVPVQPEKINIVAAAVPKTLHVDMPVAGALPAKKVQSASRPAESRPEESWFSRTLSSFGSYPGTSPQTRKQVKPQFTASQPAINQPEPEQPAPKPEQPRPQVSAASVQPVAKLPSDVYKPVRNSAEIAYDNNGNVAYVTYTFNGSKQDRIARKKNRWQQ